MNSLKTFSDCPHLMIKSDNHKPFKTNLSLRFFVYIIKEIDR